MNNPNLGEISDYELFLDEMGCGIVSAADLLLYLAKSRPEFAPFIQNSVQYTQNGFVEYQSYCEFIKSINNYIPIMGIIIQKEGEEDNWNSGGVYTFSYFSGLNNYAIQNGINLWAYWNTSKELLLPGIKDMLQKDIPVPLLMGDGSKDDGISFYREIIPRGSQRYILNNFAQKVNCHYVNITGLLEDHIGGKTILEISSWGKRFYISYEDYVDYAEGRSSGGYNGNNICYISVG